MEASDKIAAVHKYVEAFEKGSLDLIRDLYAADATVEDPVGTEVRVGIDAICEFYQVGFDGNAKLVLDGTPRCAGNAVAFSFVVDAMGMKIEVTDTFEFNEQGKVCTMKAYWGPENVAV